MRGSEERVRARVYSHSLRGEESRTKSCSSKVAKFTFGKKDGHGTAIVLSDEVPSHMDERGYCCCCPVCENRLLQLPVMSEQ